MKILNILAWIIFWPSKIYSRVASDEDYSLNMLILILLMILQIAWWAVPFIILNILFP